MYFILDFCITIAVCFLPQKQSIILWRIVSIFTIIMCIRAFYYCQYTYGLITLFGTCFLVVPFIPGTSQCCECGKKLYWRGLISNRCPNCKKNYY